jgi:murein DD-endopeptidase MepM/ murein hydrolase activator NlpD
VSIPFLFLNFGLPILVGVAAFLVISYVEMSRGVITLYQVKMSKEAAIEELLVENTTLKREREQRIAQMKDLIDKTERLSQSLQRIADENAQIWSIVRGTPAMTTAARTAPIATTARGETSRGAPPGAERGEPRGAGERDALSDEEDLQELTRSRLDSLLNQTQTIQKDFTSLRSSAENYRRKMDHTPSVAPVPGYVTSPFGYRYHPIYGDRRFHEGIDIGAPSGTPIKAAANGTVTKSGRNGNYGIMVEISHGYGFTTVYAHNSRNVVKVGDTVKKGQVIAYVGSTGASTAPHLHYEVRVNGRPVNPTTYMK